LTVAESWVKSIGEPGRFWAANRSGINERAGRDKVPHRC
jgi:hypothetical protein